MYMSVHEITSMYKEAADKNAQIEILADLNACSKDEILLVLQNEGLISGVKATKKATPKAGKKHKAEKMTWNDEAKEKVRSLLQEGLTVLEVAERMGLDFTQVRNAVTRYKLRGMQSAKCETRNTEATPHQSPAATASPQGEATESAEQKMDPLSVVSLIRDYARCITSLPSADIRNYEKIVRTFAESIIEGVDSIINFSAKEYGVPGKTD